MVHSTYAQGHVMGGRDIHSPLGIPKSPSFHSGLDLVASVAVEESVKKALDQHETTGFPGKISFYSGNISNLIDSSPQTPLISLSNFPISSGSGCSVRFPESHGLSSGNNFGGSDSNALTMINGKTNVNGVSGSAVTGTMKNGIGSSTQTLTLQNNSTAVRSMQAMGQLPSLKGNSKSKYTCI